jgi:hypothetical protein
LEHQTDLIRGRFALIDERVVPSIDAGLDRTTKSQRRIHLSHRTRSVRFAWHEHSAAVACECRFAR